MNHAYETVDLSLQRLLGLWDSVGTFSSHRAWQADTAI